MNRFSLAGLDRSRKRKHFIIQNQECDLVQRTRGSLLPANSPSRTKETCSVLSVFHGRLPVSRIYSLSQRLRFRRQAPCPGGLSALRVRCQTLPPNSDPRFCSLLSRPCFRARPYFDIRLVGFRVRLSLRTICRASALRGFFRNGPQRTCSSVRSGGVLSGTVRREFYFFQCIRS